MNKENRFLIRARIYLKSNLEIKEDRREHLALKSEKKLDEIFSDWKLFTSYYNILDEEIGYHNIDKNNLKNEFTRKIGGK